MTDIRSQPCTACPYRQDCPSGIWAYADYEKLRAFDNLTSAQPYVGFRCHATPDHYCHGWAVVHMARGHEHELLALRLQWPSKGIPVSSVKLFASGNEAADHGQADINRPSSEAIDTMIRLIQKYPRLGDELRDDRD